MTNRSCLISKSQSGGVTVPNNISGDSELKYYRNRGVYKSRTLSKEFF